MRKRYSHPAGSPRSAAASKPRPKADGKRWLRFGIPSLDRLFSPTANDKWDAGINLRPSGAAAKSDASITDALNLHVSLCVIGPSGTGKSLLGLHMASRYWADSNEWTKKSQEATAPKVLYVSTDLGFALAKNTWESFGLHKPNNRKLPFAETIPLQDKDLKSAQVNLVRHKQEELGKLASFVTASQNGAAEGEIAFVDLAEATAGDDWGFVTRLISLLPQPQKDSAHHLLIIDAVEGLEMLTGETDSFGQQRSRRSRIAQILRTAAGKCHVVLVLEEDDAHKHPAEEYVTDVVLRLRVERDMGYLRRSLEVVKARGQSLIRGEHHYLIRGQRDSKAPDNDADKDPDRQGAKAASVPYFPDDPECSVAYIQVVRSLHSLSRVIMHLDSVGEDDARSRPRAEPGSGGYALKDLAVFATPDFGRILPDVDPADCDGHKLRGLFRSSVTSLIGDEATLKSRLGRAFLAGAFVAEACSAARTAKREEALLSTPPAEAAILLTTFNMNHSQLVKGLVSHLGPTLAGGDASKMEESIASRVICRQLEIHHLNSALLFHVIRRCVEDGLARLEKHGGGSGSNRKPSERKRAWCSRSERAGRLRVVIDDWAVIQATHPEVAADPFFLPFLIQYLQRVGVSAVIIATQPGRPEEILKTTSEQQLRALSDYHLFSWHVPFYGTDRVAITALPPIVQSLRPSVGELREARLSDGILPESKGERLWLDPHFELYKGLDEQTPKPVPMEVRLFSGSPAFDNYADQLRGLLDRLFGQDANASVLIPEDRAEYADLRDFSNLHGDTLRDHTIVMQVDEYWRNAADSDCQAQDYLEQFSQVPGDSGELMTSQSNDPFRLYQLESPISEHSLKCKRQFFAVPGYTDNGEPWHSSKAQAWWTRVPGVPYLWDFGFLLLRVRAWKGAIKNLPNPREAGLVDYVFSAIAGVFGNPDSGLNRDAVTWRDFFKACSLVSSWHNRPHWPELQPFDLDMVTHQSFACLVLEIWASELMDLNSGLAKKAFPTCRHSWNQAPSLHKDFGFVRMLAESEPGSASEPEPRYFRLALFRAWMLLSEILPAKELTTDLHQLAHRQSPHTAVAERHWYSTGSSAWKRVGGDNPVIPARLPGNFTTRGDWFLVVGKESRSLRLGERAIDLLCRRRANAERLEAGIGLPVRPVIYDAWHTDASKPYAETLTAMANFERGGRRRIVRYGDFLEQLAPVAEKRQHSQPEAAIAKDEQKSRSDEFRWLWRSRILDYHRHDRIWEKWLGRLLVESSKRMAEMRSELQTRLFEAYDLIAPSMARKTNLTAATSQPQSVDWLFTLDAETKMPDENSSRDTWLKYRILTAWRKFNTRCDTLVNELRLQPGEAR